MLHFKRLEEVSTLTSAPATANLRDGRGSVADQDIILWTAAPCWAMIRWSGARVAADIQITCVMVSMCNKTGSSKTWRDDREALLSGDLMSWSRVHQLGVPYCGPVTIPIIMNIGSGGWRDNAATCAGPPAVNIVHIVNTDTEHPGPAGGSSGHLV